MSVYYEDDMLTLHHGSALAVAAELAPGSVQTIVTSPPYFGLRDYGETGQIGAEASVGEYVAVLVALFAELRRVLADDGTLWLNLGDSYVNPSASGAHRGGGIEASKYDDHKPIPGRVFPDLGAKQLIGVPWRVALALQADGWVLRADIIWHKPNPMPESVTDRPSKAHEYLFLLAKSPRYYYDSNAIAEDASPASVARLSQAGIDAQTGSVRANGGAKTNGNMKAVGGSERVNKRSVWTVPTASFSEAHFATFPPDLIRPCILAGSRAGDTVLDPFSGSGTTGMVATQEGRRYVGIDINADYLDLSLRTRFLQPTLGIEVGS